MPAVGTQKEATLRRPIIVSSILVLRLLALTVVVPPTSTTIVEVFFEVPEKSDNPRYAAPLIEFVGPDEKVLIGKVAADGASIKVPSFCVK